MNIKELKEILNEYPENTEIVLSADAEGSRFAPLGGYNNGFLIDDEFHDVIDENQVIAHAKPAIALFPHDPTAVKR